MLSLTVLRDDLTLRDPSSSSRTRCCSRRVASRSAVRGDTDADMDVSRGEPTVSSSRSSSRPPPVWIDSEVDIVIATDVAEAVLVAEVVSLLLDAVTVTEGGGRSVVDVALVTNIGGDVTAGVGVELGTRTADMAMMADASIVGSIDHLLGLLATWRSVWLAVGKVVFESSWSLFRGASRSLADLLWRSIGVEVFNLPVVLRPRAFVVGLAVDWLRPVDGACR